MRFTILFFLVLGYSATVFAEQKESAEVDAAPAEPPAHPKAPIKKLIAPKPAPVEKKEEEVKIEAAEETEDEKKEKTVEIKKIEKEEPKVTEEPIVTVVASTEQPKEEEKEGIISNVVNTVVKVTKSIANKVKNFFGIGEENADENSSTVVVETVTSVSEKVEEVPATAAPKKE